jgi:phosphopantothenoylcysteine decarboxylase/phosphopantothenate--cysteine ligase
MRLNGKNVVLCITGGIAAYKAVGLASKLRKMGATVHVVMTEHATRFVTPLTLKTITRNKVTVDMFDESDFVPHISLADLADVVIVAPATANCMAKAANGIADDMVTTLLLSTDAPRVFVPAMNTRMWENPATMRNMEMLKQDGFSIIKPDCGLMACGTSGAGRYPDNNRIISFVLRHGLPIHSAYTGTRILITAGGTIEDIDPVRFISNRSSGRMGFSIAEQLYYHGTDITMITGNVDQEIYTTFIQQHPDITIIPVRSAEEMKNAVLDNKDGFDIYCMAAAVADFSPVYSKSKIKKQAGQGISLQLERTDDILKELPRRDDAFYIGFAAETGHLIEQANDKLVRKKLDVIVGNRVDGARGAIGSTMAEIIILNQWNDSIIEFEHMEKPDIARNMIRSIEPFIQKKLG